MQKINNEQIEELYAFTRNHFVEYYDLQTELVDHLANDIEAMWEKQPELNFEDAKNAAFKKFGVFGFLEPIEQKQKAMGRRYRGFLWNEFKAWFTLPKVVFTLLIFVIFYTAFSSIYVKYFSITFYLGIAIWSIYRTIQLNRIFRRRKEKSNKKWMMEEMIFKQAGGTLLVFMSQIHTFYNLSESFTLNAYTVAGLATVFTILFLVSYISFQLLPEKAEELLNKTYPEYAL